MKKSPALQSLRDLEKHYAKMLRNVRELIEDSGGEVESPTPANRTNGTPTLAERVSSFSELSAATILSPKTSLERLTKAEAVLQVLREEKSYEFDKNEMFEKLRQRGHAVKNVAALVSMLSGDSRFMSEGQGLWSLAEPDLSEVNGHDKGAET
jgi:2-methylisocitrate lyase-like PEP mutase family enzyme